MMHVSLGNGIGYEVEGDLKTRKAVRFVPVGVRGRSNPTLAELAEVIRKEFPKIPKEKVIVASLSNVDYSSRVCILYYPRK